MGTRLVVIRMLQTALTIFFVNIDPVLASNIHRSHSDNDFTQYLSKMNNMDSMYVEPVTEEEIL